MGFVPDIGDAGVEDVHGGAHGGVRLGGFDGVGVGVGVGCSRRFGARGLGDGDGGGEGRAARLLDEFGDAWEVLLGDELFGGVVDFEACLAVVDGGEGEAWDDGGERAGLLGGEACDLGPYGGGVGGVVGVRSGRWWWRRGGWRGCWCGVDPGV